MRIPCLFCGHRDVSEFAYLGDANAARLAADTLDADRVVFEAVYLRDNPSGLHLELWYHASGCRSWLEVERNTRTHEITKATFACDGVRA
ncbi:MAG TPA: sarcosine oxidase subunit delta [Bradyrhizobium sp.]|jgi:sarcosine oxidase subunit delta|nr:sarcosine oxidase subunit delta [Bradyrhizobium sp.]